MRIGIDIQHLRLDRRGIYYYVWNVVEGLVRLKHPHPVTLFLYGEPWMDDPEWRQRLHDAFPGARFVYYWDLPPLRLLAHWWRRPPHEAPVPLRQIDQRFLLRRWRKRAAAPDPARLPPLPEVDVLHHPSGLLLPTAGHANVLTIHDLIPFHMPRYSEAATNMFGPGFANALQMDMILTYSDYTKQDVVKSLGVPEENIRMIPLAAHPQCRPITDPNVLQPVLAKYGLADRPYVLHLGAVEERKNLHRLIDAFQLMKQEQPPLPHRLVIAGQGPLVMNLRAKIHRLGLTPHARCLGFVPDEDLPPLLSGADLCVLPSLYEGFGLPPLEAMTCGTPVVASNTTSVPEVVGDSGLLVDPLDVPAIAAAMYRVAKDPALQAELRARGLARAREFSWAKTAQRTLEAYAEAFRRHQEKERRCPNFATRYRDVMRQHAVEQLAKYLATGSSISEWPF